MTSGGSEARENDTYTAPPEKQKPLFLRIPSGSVIIGAFGLGAVYAFAYLYVIDSSKKCAPSAGFVGPYEPSFFGCLEINEIGDALGGAFGPLAFLFLAAALLIQAMELAAQRWELDETQEVMREQLKVAKQQVAESKASTEFLREQALAIKEEARRQRELEADREFNSLKTRFAARCVKRSDKSLEFKESGNSTILHAEWLGVNGGIGTTFDECYRVFSIQLPILEKLLRGPKVLEWNGDVTDLLELESDIQELLDKLPSLSSAGKADFDRYDLFEMRKKIRYLISHNSHINRM